MSNILLLEPNREKVPNLVFLLKLADIQCTVARSVEEALNWLSAYRLKVISFDLFLVNSLSGDELEKQLLTEASSFTTVPIVGVQRDDLSRFEYQGHEIIICQPNNLLNCLKKHLVSKNKQLPEEKIQ